MLSCLTSPGRRQDVALRRQRGEGPAPGQGITWTYQRQGRFFETHLETVSFRRQISEKHANLTASCLRQAVFRTRCCPQHPTNTTCDVMASVRLCGGARDYAPMHTRRPPIDIANGRRRTSARCRSRRRHNCRRRCSSSRASSSRRPHQWHQRRRE